MTPDPLTTSDPADTSCPAFIFALYLTTSTLPLAPAQRVVVVNDPDRLQDLTTLYPDAAFWGRAAFWKFVQSLREDLPQASPQDLPADEAAQARETTQADNRRLLTSINNLKLEFGPAAVGVITGDPLDWFRKIGAAPLPARATAERPGVPTSEGQAPGA